MIKGNYDKLHNVINLDVKCIFYEILKFNIIKYMLLHITKISAQI
jgi:hypothetical protein